MNELEPTPEQVRQAWVRARTWADKADVEALFTLTLRDDGSRAQRRLCELREAKARTYALAAKAQASVAQAGALILANRHAP